MQTPDGIVLTIKITSGMIESAQTTGIEALDSPGGYCSWSWHSNCDDSGHCSSKGAVVLLIDVEHGSRAQSEPASHRVQALSASQKAAGASWHRAPSPSAWEVFPACSCKLVKIQFLEPHSTLHGTRYSGCLEKWIPSPC